MTSNNTSSPSTDLNDTVTPPAPPPAQFHEGDQRFRFMAEASAILAESLDYEITLQVVAELVVPRLADWFAIDLLDSDDPSRFAHSVVFHRDPVMLELGMELRRRYPPDPKEVTILQTRQPVFVTTITDEQIRAGSKDDYQYEVYSKLGLESVLVVPLLIRERVLGNMSLFYAFSGRSYTASDLPLVEDLARRISVAIENAQSFRLAQRELAERQRIADELQVAKDQLEIVLQTIPTGISLQEGKSARQFFANNAMATMLGFPNAQTLLDTPPLDALASLDMFNEDGSPFPLDQIPARLAREGVANTERVIRVRSKRTGVERLLLARSIPVPDDAGEIRYTVSLFRDITEQRKSENAIRALNDELAQRVAELRGVNNELTTFTFIISHDLRTPLVNLKGFSSELATTVNELQTAIQPALSHLDAESLARVRQAVDVDIPEALGFIRSAAERMDRLTNAVLQLSRTGRRDLHPEMIALEPLVNSILNTLAYQIRESRTEVSVAPLPSVYVDRIAIEQIMGNLLANAVVYLEPTRPGRIEIFSDSTDDSVSIHVRDNGRGIAEKDFYKVFMPFQRAGKSNVEGEGMGLAYVQTLVRRHNGHIGFTSAVGVGTTFTVTLPRGTAGSS